jgi:hypothetical protein
MPNLHILFFAAYLEFALWCLVFGICTGGGGEDEKGSDDYCPQRLSRRGTD